MSDLDEMDESLLDFGPLLKRYLNQRDLPAAWLARQVEVDPGTVSRWINEKASPSSMALVSAIVRALALSETQERRLVESAGYLYQPPAEPPPAPAPPQSVAPPAPPSQIQLIPDALTGFVTRFFLLDRMRGEEGRYPSAWVIHLMVVLAHHLSASSVLRLLLLAATGSMGYWLLGDALQWPLPFGHARAVIAAKWAAGGLILPLVLAFLTTPDGEARDGPWRTQLGLKWTGAATGWYLAATISFAFVILRYQVGWRALSDVTVGGLVAVQMLFSIAVAQRIPADRYKMFGVLKAHEVDRMFWLTGMLIPPIIGLWLYLGYGLLAERPEGLMILFVALLLVTFIAFRDENRESVPDWLAIGLVGVGAPLLVLAIALFSIWPPGPLEPSDPRVALLLFGYIVALTTSFATHAVRGIFRATGRSMVAALFLLLTLQILVTLNLMVGRVALLILLIVWLVWGRHRFRRSFAFHPSIVLQAVAIGISLGVLTKGWLPPGLHLLLFWGVSFLLTLWAYRAPRLLPEPTGKQDEAS